MSIMPGSNSGINLSMGRNLSIPGIFLDSWIYKEWKENFCMEGKFQEMRWVLDYPAMHDISKMGNFHWENDCLGS